MIGYPSRRLRVLTFNLSRDRLIWTGPAEAEEVRKDFLSVFGRQTILDGDVYLAAADDLVADYYRHRLAKKRMHVDAGAPFSFRGRAILRSFLPPGEVVRLDDYSKVYEVEHANNPTRSFIADLEQNVGQAGDSSGAWFPSQLTHGTYYSFSQRRLILGLEHLLANGLNAGLHPTSVSPLAEVFQSMSGSQQKQLSGNGMNMQTLACWILYVAMNIKRKESDKLHEEHRLLQTLGGDDDSDPPDSERPDVAISGDSDVLDNA